MNIKKLRIEAGLKQEDMAEIIGLTKAGYCKEENGDVRFSLADAKAISDYFKKPIESIFYEETISKYDT